MWSLFSFMFFKKLTCYFTILQNNALCTPEVSFVLWWMIYFKIELGIALPTSQYYDQAVLLRGGKLSPQPSNAWLHWFLCCSLEKQRKKVLGSAEFIGNRVILLTVEPALERDPHPVRVVAVIGKFLVSSLLNLGVHEHWHPNLILTHSSQGSSHFPECGSLLLWKAGRCRLGVPAALGPSPILLLPAVWLWAVNVLFPCTSPSASIKWEQEDLIELLWRLSFTSSSIPQASETCCSPHIALSAEEMNMNEVSLSRGCHILVRREGCNGAGGRDDVSETTDRGGPQSHRKGFGFGATWYVEP